MTDEQRIEQINIGKIFDLVHPAKHGALLPVLTELFPHRHITLPDLVNHQMAFEDAAVMAVKQATGFDLESMKKQCRKKENVGARRAYLWLLRIGTPMSLSEIGGRIKRDHATVINCKVTLENLICTDRAERDRVAEICEILMRNGFSRPMELFTRIVGQFEADQATRRHRIR